VSKHLSEDCWECGGTGETGTELYEGLVGCWHCTCDDCHGELEVKSPREAVCEVCGLAASLKAVCVEGMNGYAFRYPRDMIHAASCVKDSSTPMKEDVAEHIAHAFRALGYRATVEKKEPKMTFIEWLKDNYSPVFSEQGFTDTDLRSAWIAKRK
jgi:hypothetical protein